MAVVGSKPSVNEEAIRYQARTKLALLVGEIAEARKLLSPEVKAKVKKATIIRLWLKALDYKEYLSREQREKIWYALIDLADINELPTSPLLELRSTPNILVGIPGAIGVGEPGQDGQDGQTGLATDFETLGLTFSQSVDNFDITDARAARWDYVVTEAGGALRAGSVVGVWKSDGSGIDLYDTSTPDVGSSTAGIEFDVQFSSGQIFLVAVITSGTWDIEGTRYFIPNNGNGTGPISGSLADGLVYIGNTLNLAQARLITGALSITNTGVSSLNNITATRVVIGAASGQLTNSSNLTFDEGTGELATFRLSVSNLAAIADLYLNPISQNDALTQVLVRDSGTSQIRYRDASTLGFADPMTTAGDTMIRNALNVTARLPIGAENQIYTVIGGVPTWANAASGFADPMTTSGDVIIRNGLSTARLGIGTERQVFTVSGGLPSWEDGYSDPLTTNGDLLVRAGGVTTRLAAGSLNQFLTTSGSASSWATITDGATNELQKNGGSGLLASSGVYATSTGVGIGVAAPTVSLDVRAVATINATVKIESVTGQAELNLVRTGGTASNWSLYSPTGSTDLRLYSAADRYTFSSAGDATATGSWRVSSGGLTSYMDNDEVSVGGGVVLLQRSAGVGVATISGGIVLSNGISGYINTSGGLSFSVGSSVVDWNAARHTDAADPVGAQDLVTLSYLGSYSRETESGIYTPTTSDLSGLASATPTSFQYARVGNTVTASGQVAVTISTPQIGTGFDLSLPPLTGGSANFAGTNELAGSGVDNFGVARLYSIQANTTTDKAQFTSFSVAADPGTYTLQVHFTYRIIET